MRNKLTFLCFKLLPPLIIQRRTVYLLSVCPLCGGMGMLSVALSLPLAEDCASKKKVAGDICFPERKKNPPHQCERRRQRQTSAQSCGSHWLALCTKSNSNHFTHNTPTNPKGVHAASLLHSAAVATLQNLM